MKKLIELVRKLRRIALFKLSARAVTITLMLIGLWVATKQLELPSNIPLSDKLIHLGVFFGFAVLMDLGIERKPFWLWKGLPLFLYGIGIEITQIFIPYREFSWLDIIANILGVIVYFVIKRIVKFYGNIV